MFGSLGDARALGELEFRVVEGRGIQGFVDDLKESLFLEVEDQGT